ncbi:GGDEF domain-containing protein [Vibrio chagasii]|nr:GGDEF domain-containing protein [Vibrio chagasii]CAH6846403.1 GGDEF domain-containing protein [Vibrio chagasii]CAH6847447.1 GGDEF domain-containing protein [Vibrio chagasii]CAH6849952.1 GGDEF domain-containing protein [Vibrio chagasii]CAH6858935.1 GGDEF domain-containing protein [Vibrio chagasii]
MALPKTLIRLFKPYIILLTGGMLYLAAAQLEKVETAATNQSASNIRIASATIRSNIEAVFGKLYFLETSLGIPNATDFSDQKFRELSDNILKRTPNFSDIIRYKPNSQHYVSTRGLPLSNEQIATIQWHSIDGVVEDFYISSVYQKADGRWVFAVKHTAEKLNEEIWIEFDLMHTTQGLRDLKTLNNGYVFVVDRATERLVFHPVPQRIGSKSISFHAGISHQLSQGELAGKHEYYYQDNFKISVFDADNSLNWVFIAGTDRHDILTSSHQFTLTGLVLGSLLLLWIGANYLAYRLNVSLSQLNKVEDLASFKRKLKSILDNFTYHKGIQFCLYQPENHSFSTLDYHGNKSTVHCDKSLSERFVANAMVYRNGKDADPLARKLKIDQRHYCIPLYSRQQLIAVLYVNARLPISQSILRMIRDYTEVSLSNLLLQHQLSSKDLMTQLDNKSSFNIALENYANQPETYIALLDIDNFDHVNRAYGEAVGDKMIKLTAEALRSYFPKPKGLCLARVGGKEFAVLFKANGANDAKLQLDQCRIGVAEKTIVTPDISLSLGVSVGFSQIEGEPDTALALAEQAKLIAQQLGKNRVEGHIRAVAKAS